MASYLELKELINDSQLPNRIDIATIVFAKNLLANTPTAADKAYAELVFTDPNSQGSKLLMAILAVNKDLTIAQIQESADSVLQNQVDSIAPSLVDALAGV